MFEAWEKVRDNRGAPGVDAVSVTQFAAEEKGASEQVSFDFLGYTFRGRTVLGRRGLFIGFNPAMSTKATKAVQPEDQGLASQPSQ